MRYDPKKVVINFILLFFIGVIMLYIIRNIEDYFISSAILAFIVVVSMVIYKSESKKNLTIEKKGLMRYTLLCHCCNWEWMSNATNKKYSKKCPNCSETSKIEIIGIRRVHKLLKRSNKDLTNYFKK